MGGAFLEYSIVLLSHAMNLVGPAVTGGQQDATHTTLSDCDSS